MTVAIQHHLATVASDIAQTILGLSHRAGSSRERDILTRAARQMWLIAESVGVRAIDIEYARAYIDAARIFIYEWTVQHARLG